MFKFYYNVEIDGYFKCGKPGEVIGNYEEKLKMPMAEGRTLKNLRASEMN